MNLLGGTREKRVLEEEKDKEIKNGDRRDKEENEREGVNKDYFLKENGEGLVIMKIKEKVRGEGKGEGKDVMIRAVRRAV